MNGQEEGKVERLHGNCAKQAEEGTGSAGTARGLQLTGRRAAPSQLMTRAAQWRALRSRPHIDSSGARSTRATRLKRAASVDMGPSTGAAVRTAHSRVKMRLATSSHIQPTASRRFSPVIALQL